MQDLPSQSCQDLIAEQLPFLPKEKHTEGLLTVGGEWPLPKYSNMVWRSGSPPALAVSVLTLTPGIRVS